MAAGGNRYGANADGVPTLNIVRSIANYIYVGSFDGREFLPGFLPSEDRDAGSLLAIIAKSAGFKIKKMVYSVTG